MSLRHKETVNPKERMDSSSIILPEKLGVEPAQNVGFTVDPSAPRSDNTSVTCQRERRRREHNDLEKKRKEQIKACIGKMGELLPPSYATGERQIKACIGKMGELLPPSYATGERQSTLEIVEKSLMYMREMKEARTKFADSEESLNQELASLTVERDKLLDIIKAAGLSSDTIPTNGVSSTTDVKDDSPKPKLKTKKKNTLNSQLQLLQDQRDKEKLSQQEMISSSVSVTEESMNNLGGPNNPMMNMPNAGMVNGQNVMFNPMMMQAGNQFMMPGMVGASNQMMGPMGMVNPGANAGNQFPGMQNMSMPSVGAQNGLNDQGNAMMNKCMDDSESGLLQLAMQDAGITPHSGASQPGSSAVTPSITDTTSEVESSESTQNNALQTLASVATSHHGVSTELNMTENQAVSLSVAGSISMSSMSTSLPLISSQAGYSQAGYQPMLQSNNNGNNAFLNMPVMGNQHMMQAGQQQTQQVMFINEQGIPMIASVPVGPDPNSQSMFSNLQKQGLMPGMNQQSLVKDQSGNIEQNSLNNALALAQQQANMAALQGQLLGQGGNLQQMSAFQQGLLNGSIIQTQNGQFIQQINPQAQLQGQGQIIGMPGQNQGIMVGGQQNPLPVSQNGNLVTFPSQPNQLPSALILPNGQIIPVVTNPNSVASQNGAMLNPHQFSQTRMSGSQLQNQLPAGLEGHMVSGSQGLLMPVSGAPTGSTASAGATLTTNVVPTSAIQSVMTTQIQGSSVQSQKVASSGSQGSATDVYHSLPGQPKVVGLPQGAVTSAAQVGPQGILQPGGKSAATPILISLPINGQPTTVLLDPVTMQVLGTVNPQQQGTSTVSVTAPTVTPAATSLASQPANPPPPTTGKGKNKNNANQRAICPKPSSGGDHSKHAATPSKKKKSSKASNKNKEPVQPDSLSDSLQIQIPESTTDPEVTSAISSESTDILAKAAESIFSSPLGEMGTGEGFYNPANEDNPLTIDTSVTEADEENKSPSKSVGERKRVDSGMSVSGHTLEDNVMGLNSVADGTKTFSVTANTTKVASRSSGSFVNSNKTTEASSHEHVTSLSATLEEIAGGMGFDDSQDNVMQMDTPQERNSELMDISVDNKVDKKSKANASAKTVDNKKEPQAKQSKKSAAAKTGNTAAAKTGNTAAAKTGNTAAGKQSSQKKPGLDKSAVSVEMEKTDSDSQMDIESTIIHIPEAINFSENDLSSVLDQVEQLGNSSVPSPQRGQTAKKPKAPSKRSKATTEAENEPASKKRKGNKEGKESKSGKSVKEVPLSMPSSLSVYDFDDSDDIVPSILPLNGKDFTSLSSSTQSMPTKSELGLIDNSSNESRSNSGSKTSKSSAQSKSQSTTSQKNTTNKSAKIVTDASNTKLIDENSNSSLFNFTETFDKPLEKDNTKEKTEVVKTAETSSSDTLHSMPDLDTTTSLFGFPIPKKLQRPDTSYRQAPQVSPKPVSHVSPKPVSQASPKPTVPSNTAPKPNTVSPKPIMTSPKTSMVSPKQSIMSPDMISPKLNIIMSPDMNSPKLNIVSPDMNSPRMNIVSPDMHSPRLNIVSPDMHSPRLNIVSPDMMSPKLNIVSPSQSLMSDNESVTASPKHYTEMSPLKKRVTSERIENVKISTFSALNSTMPSTVSEISVSVSLKDNLVTNVATSKQPGVITTSKSSLSPSVMKSENIEPLKSKDTNIKAPVDSYPARFETMDTGSKGQPQNSQPASMPSNKSPINSMNNFNPPNMDNDSNIQNMPSSKYNNNSNMTPRSHPSHSVNTSQNHKYGPSPPKYGNEPVYGSMMAMNNKQMSKENNMSGTISTMNTFPGGPYSSESLFSNQDKVIKSPPNVNIQNNPNMLNQDKQNANMKHRNNAYSVDSFVQSSRDDGMRLRNTGVPSQPDLMDTGDLGNHSSDFNRLQSASSPEGFNFANIGLNLPPITTTAPSSNFMDMTMPNSSSVITSNSSSFSFSLSSTSATVTTTSTGVLGQHQFPFYPVLSASSSASSSEAGMANMGMFGQNNVIQRNNTVMHPSGSSANMQRPDNSHMSRMDSNISRVDNQHGMQRGDGPPQPVMSDEVNRDHTSTSKSSCSKQTKMSKVPSQSSLQDSCSFSNPGPGREQQNFFHDSQMKSNVGKSPTDQMRKPPDMNPSQSLSSNQPSHQGSSHPGSSHQGSSHQGSSHQEKQRANIDRSPQMMNTAPQYFPPNYPPSKSLNTPPLHHPTLMPPDDRSRNMTNRSPYDHPYHPPSSQGFNPMNHNYPPNRFEASNYNRDNSGTQPLTHTPVNTGGRKSANPQQSVVKAPPKQSAPPLVPMAPQQPPSQGPRPTPPQSHRANTPINNNNNPPPPAPTPTQVNQSRHTKQPSRSKQPSKKKQPVPPFVEVDSNLSNSIFETNRSMTPFFPMQNLSPQSRAMQHEGSPFPLGNFFGPGPRFPNSNSSMPKNSDIGPPFNPLFPPRGAQNGLGLNFQPGFGMNMNPLHSNHGNGPQITPHTAPHMTNFNLNNIFSDVNSASQNESSLNISPIKFPHTNFQHQGMEHNPMQHHHQYNRGHPSVMSINSILGPNHHGFDGRMNTSMAGFHSHPHPSFMPTLNFSMHDH